MERQATPDFSMQSHLSEVDDPLLFTEPFQPSFSQDDSDGHLLFNVGEVILNRYQILALLGEGTFGRVVKARDHLLNSHVALKIVSNLEDSTEEAKGEIRTLRLLEKFDPSNRFLCARMLNHFDFYHHVLNPPHKCLVFELLGISIYDFMQQAGNQPFSMEQVRHLAYQMCFSVNFLHEHSLVHSDLKPENFVFANPQVCEENLDTRIKLIDFGAVVRASEGSEVAGTQQYRAPEVAMGLRWGRASDVFSLCLVFAELYTGQVLLDSRDDRQHLAMMQHTFGRLPTRMRRKYCSDSFPLPEDLEHARRTCKPLMEHMRHYSEEHAQLFALLRATSAYVPSARVTLRKALDHAFFNRLHPEQLFHKLPQ